MTQQPLSPDDPRLTAYLLGELNDAERAEVDALLANDPAAQQALAELLDLTGSITRALATEPLPKLRSDRREAVLATMQEVAEGVAPLKAPAISVESPGRSMRLGWGAGVVAACSVMGLTILIAAMNHNFQFQSGSWPESINNSEPQQVAQSSPIQGISDTSAVNTYDAFHQNSKPVPDQSGQSLNEANLPAVQLEQQLDQRPLASLETQQTPAEPPVSLVESSTNYSLQPLGHSGGGGNRVPLRGSVESSSTISPLSRPGLLTGPSPGTQLNPGMGETKPAPAQRPYKLTSDSQSNTSAGDPRSAAPARTDSLSIIPGTAGEAGQSPSTTPQMVSNSGPVNNPVPAAGQPSTLGLPEEIKRESLRFRNSAPGGEPGAKDGEDDSNRLLARSGSLPELELKERLNERDSWEFRIKAGGLNRSVPGTESYAAIVENEFVTPEQAPFSTFGVDVDTASYSNVRRFLDNNQWPPANSVRLEELINAFQYSVDPPTETHPVNVAAEAGSCPWQPRHQLVRVSVKGKEINIEDRPATSLVFLIDKSGSMSDANKLPLLKDSLRLLVEELHENDRVSIVTYANGADMVLEGARANERSRIMNAIDSLNADGSTNGEAGLNLAYEVAIRNRIAEGSNRILVCTDGDFNVGTSDDNALFRLIGEKKKSNIFLSILGFGSGNIKDSKLEGIADHGNGQYMYIDGLKEARRVLVEQLTGTLYTIAKDVKLQVEFNPAKVAYYRLLGYENRALAAEDFNNDTVDAGDMGAGHTVTALYEIVPAGIEPQGISTIDESRYAKPATPAETAPEAEPVLEH